LSEAIALLPAPSQWAPDVLLQSTVQSVPRFLRTEWDESAASAFGPWRVLQRTDPLGETDVFGAQPPGTTAAARATHDTQRADLPPPPADPVPPAQPSPDLLARMQEQLQAAREEAFAEGLQAGSAQALDALELERTRERELLRHLCIELRALHEDPQRFFEPLKRLAVRLAEELVRAELQVSGRVIQQLVRQSLDQLGVGADKAVVHLNPDDLLRLQAMGAPVTTGLRLQADPDLRMGSVRVRYNETVVQDLIENRLEALVRPLLNDPEAWLGQSGLLNTVHAMPSGGTDSAAPPAWKRSSAERTAPDDVEDATPRMEEDRASRGADMPGQDPLGDEPEEGTEHGL
jgi:flagellar biosynthesis/type III secretory pathway protein FliH